MASKKTACARVRRGVAGKTREEIMEVIRAEFDLPPPKARADRSEATAKPAPGKAPRKARS